MKATITNDMKILLNSRDAAAFYGVSPRLWRVWHRLGFTPMPIKIGRLLF